MEQLYIFLICVVCGIAGGAIYDLLFCLRYPVKIKWLTPVTDALFCVLFAGLYLFVSLFFGLPSMRLFMFLGCILGFFLYLKSFHKIVAFLAEKVYNRGVKEVQRIRGRRKSCRKEAISRKKKRKKSR